jgi:MoxR-like ATPase
VRILRLRRERRGDQPQTEPVLARDVFLEMQAVLEDIFVDPSIEGYIVDLVRATRGDTRLALGASPQASLALMKMARAVSGLMGRGFVIPDDVKRVAAAVLAHRLVLRPENWGGRINAAQVVDSLLSQITAPAAEVRRSFVRRRSRRRCCSSRRSP